MSTPDTISIWSATFSGVATVVAIVAVIIAAAKQSCYGRRSAIAADKSAEASNRSASAAERSAAAAEEAVRQAKKAGTTAAEGTRARIVFLDPPDTSVDLGPSKQIVRVAITAANTGKTPASRRTSRHALRGADPFVWPEETARVKHFETPGMGVY